MEFDRSIRTAFELYQSGRLEEAEDIAGALSKESPDSAEVLHLLGLIFHRKGNYPRALKNIRRALRCNPNDSDVYYDLGNILHDQGQISRALASYRKAVKIDPTYAEAYNNMGIALQDNARLDKAIKCYQKALKINPRYAEAHNNLGVALQERGRPAESITHFQQALMLRPDYTSAYNNLVDSVQGKGPKSKPEGRASIVYAVYRCYYGEDFIQESIRSVTDYVDRIFIFVDRTPWGDIKHCSYLGSSVEFPKKIDNVVKKIRELNNPKIELVFNHWARADNQMTHLVNNVILKKYEEPSIILSLEVDHVFRRGELKKALDEFLENGYVFATTSQIEIWKGLRHRLPDRPNRVGAVLCNLSKLEKMPATLKHGGIIVMPKLSAYVHDFGFAVSDKVMYWRHLLSIAQAQKTGDAPPYENWYEEKWLKWDYESNNGDLSISDQQRIEPAIPYNVSDLPEPIKEKYLG